MDARHHGAPLRRLVLLLVPILGFALASCSGGGGGDDVAGTVETWNTIAVNASGLDHTQPGPGDVHQFGHQLGPCRSSRAMAIVHIAMFDALNAIERRHVGYTDLEPGTGDESKVAAIAQAAHDTLVALFPSQAATFDEELERTLHGLGHPARRLAGAAIGAQAAAAILALRADDGANHAEPQIDTDFFPGIMPGEWRQDPVSLLTVCLGANWPNVTPFVMSTAGQFVIPPPPALASAEYAAAYAEVVALGGDGVTTPTSRTIEQTETGIFWAYDGTPSLCAPPRLYNQIALQIARQQGVDEDGSELLRLLALVNVAMADTGIAAWDSKYLYEFWRPVTGVREADAGSGPSGLGDGNPATVAILDFMPLGAPASNLSGPNFTPPFPAYPSGHAAFGGALFQVLRRWFDTDAIAFEFVSDEYNGVTAGSDGVVRPYKPRNFDSLSEAEEENGQSRIYLGIHWSFDKTTGIVQGNAVGDLVFDTLFQPIAGR